MGGAGGGRFSRADEVSSAVGEKGPLSAAMGYMALKRALQAAGVPPAELSNAPTKPALLTLAERYGLSVAWEGSARDARARGLIFMGRMITMHQLRCKDVPDMDYKNTKAKAKGSDPYLIVCALNEAGEAVDEARTAALDNEFHPRWDETLRLFAAASETERSPQPLARQAASKQPLGRKAASAKVEASPQAACTVLVKLMDKNMKKADAFIGEVRVPLAEGKGRVKMEVPSQHPCSMRPFLFFAYELTPPMYCETAAFELLEAVEAVDVSDDYSADEGQGEEGAGMAQG